MAKSPTRFRSGTLSASIFENTYDVDGETHVANNIRIERSYKDKNDAWQTQHIDLPARQLDRALAVLSEAQHHLLIDKDKDRQARRAARAQDAERER